MHTYSLGQQTTHLLHTCVRTETRMPVTVFTQWNNLALKSNHHSECVSKQIIPTPVKRCSYPYARMNRPLGFQEAEILTFPNNRHMKVVTLSALSTGCLHPQEIFLVIILLAESTPGP
jgi:hypothetical protein